MSPKAIVPFGCFTSTGFATCHDDCGRLDVAYQHMVDSESGGRTPCGPSITQHFQAFQVPHSGTHRTIFHIIWSREASISFEGWLRVFVSAAQHIPVDVRTMIVVVPGRLPPCHQLPAPLFLTSHPRAYRACAFGSYAGAGVVIILIVDDLSKAGIPVAPATWFRN